MIMAIALTLFCSGKYNMTTPMELTVTRPDPMPTITPYDKKTASMFGRNDVTMRAPADVMMPTAETGRYPKRSVRTLTTGAISKLNPNAVEPIQPVYNKNTNC